MRVWHVPHSKFANNIIMCLSNAGALFLPTPYHVKFKPAAENEANVRHVLDTYPLMQLVPAEPRVGCCGLQTPADPAAYVAVLAAAAAAVEDRVSGRGAAVLAAFAEAQAQQAAAREAAGRAVWWLTAAQAAMVQRFHPADTIDTIGFFVAKFVKVSSSE